MVIISLVGLVSSGLTAQTPAKKTTEAKELATEAKLFETDKGWGYDIYVKGKKYIHQTSIPSVPGTAGFTSEKDAEKVANLVVGKVNRNEMPPSVTPEELKELKIKLPDDPKKSTCCVHESHCDNATETSMKRIVIRSK